ncbi:MAG: hypothetical protein K1060chlam2_01391, partial [Chlamydiae bacterium]|nr:hypothetical protein [Chlamydiota bacterium]
MKLDSNFCLKILELSFYSKKTILECYYSLLYTFIKFNKENAMSSYIHS